MLRGLRFIARHGRACLVAGLFAGLLLPGFAAAMRPWLPHLVGLLVFVAALRIGPRAALGSFGDLPQNLSLLAVYQLLMPLLALAMFAFLGLASTPLSLAVVLMLSAPSVTGAPNFTILLGREPAPALRLMILGTAVFPLTVLPTLALAPGLEDMSVFAAAGRLLLVILSATGAAFALRASVLRELTDDGQAAIDGTSALLLAIVVVGLMSAVGPALRETTVLALGWLVAAMIVNLGLQCAAAFAFRDRPDVVPISIVAGNRNVALFLIALPPDVTTPILIFIGAYQVPMYLTPILMAPIYRSLPRSL